MLRSEDLSGFWACRKQIVPKSLKHTKCSCNIHEKAHVNQCSGVLAGRMWRPPKHCAYIIVAQRYGSADLMLSWTDLLGS